MSHDVQVTCAVCAWRGDCAKKFRMTDARHCPDFSRDITLPKPVEEPPADPAEERPSADEEQTE
ncbi:MAG TPA: hypothetical protein PKW95_13995 [bacterium]|nr:hypothetical protein [bacterium]